MQEIIPIDVYFLINYVQYLKYVLKAYCLSPVGTQLGYGNPL